jgi:hypothetical protein
MMPLPCPFCGGTSVTMIEGSTFRWRNMECADCGARCGEVRADTLQPDAQKREGDVYIKAVEEWNRRSQ